MKKLLPWLLLSIIVVLGSFVYRMNRSLVRKGFESEIGQTEGDHPSAFSLYYFFSPTDCRPCLETIDALKEISGMFSVVGVVPEPEIRDEPAIRKHFGIDFQLMADKHLTYRPVYSPSIVGVDRTGKIWFVIPSVPGQNEYLENFLARFYERVSPLLD